MWIPHTIPKSTFRLFAPRSKAAVGHPPNAAGGAINSEDFRWADRLPKPLRLLCLDVVCGHFARYPPELFGRITPVNAAYLVETLGTDLPIASVVHVPDGEYWRRRAADGSRSSSASSDGDKVRVSYAGPIHTNRSRNCSAVLEKKIICGSFPVRRPRLRRRDS